MSQTKKWLRENNIELVTEWKVPDDLYEPLPEGKHDARILTMPVIARPLHGPGCQPRTILGKTAWDVMRKRCYYLADYHCEACGKELGRGECQAHELFDTNWEEGYSKFVRCVCLCKTCHLQSIHVGRMLTLCKHGNPIMPPHKVVEGAENLLKNIAAYNLKHPYEPVKAYAGILDGLKMDSVKEQLQELIDKYHVEFYMEDMKKVAHWGDWRVIIGNKEYPTPYKDYKDWEEQSAMREKTSSSSKVKDVFVEPVYNEVKQILKNGGLT